MTTQQLLDERYGRRRRSSRFWGVVAACAIAGGVAIAAWFSFSGAGTSVDASTTAFTLTDEHTVELSLQVTTPAGNPIACALEAQDAEHGVVGWVIVEYPPTDAHTSAYTVSIPTVSEAATGFVNTCWVP